MCGDAKMVCVQFFKGLMPDLGIDTILQVPGGMVGGISSPSPYMVAT